MASKEYLFKTARNLTVATTVAFAGCKASEEVSQVDEKTQMPLKNLVLTPNEIDQLHRIENFISAYANQPKAEPTELVAFAAEVVPEAETAAPVRTLTMEQMSAENMQLIESYRSELPAVIEDIGAIGQDAEDLAIYYPIYRAGQDRYGVPWYLMWIIHQEESTVSINPEGLDGSVHYGAMQRALEFHKTENVDFTNRGLEFLGALPTRRFDDAREIIWATAAVSEWAGEGKDYHRALLKYSAAVHAENRWQKYLNLKANIED